MRCIEWAASAALASLVLLAGCSTPPGGSTAEVAAPSAAARSAVAPATSGPPRAPPSTGAASPGAVRLPEPRAVRTWNEVRVQAAERLVAANPGRTYMGVVPEALLAVPVLEIELNGDGSVRRIEVLRAPRQAKDTLDLATNAIHRAAPFGNVSRLPKPWKFVETFLFDDERKFKPRTLDP